MTETRPSTDLLPVPHEALLELGLTEEDIDGALERRPRHVSPSPERAVPGCWFDVDAVRRVIQVFGALRHTKTRRWAGRPLTPDPWQVVWIIAPVFGWKHGPASGPELENTRIARTLWDEIPRKNGKSTLATGVGVYMGSADGEPGAEIYSAAADRTQAARILEDAKVMVRSSAALRKRAQCLAGLIRFKSNLAIFRALSKLAQGAHGLNVHCGLIDEIHVHKSRDLIDAIETGTGARDQPLVGFFTTADEGDQGTIYAEKHDYAVAIGDGTVTDPTFWAVIWCADPDDDPFDPATWAKANPGLGTTVTDAYLAKEADRARETPTYFPTFCRLHLNLRIRSEARWFDLQVWDAGAAHLLDEPGLAGRDAYGGLDLSSTEDFTTWALVVPPDGDDPDGGMWKVLLRAWLPEGAFGKPKRKQMERQLRAWADDGWLTITTGDIVDYEAAADQLRRDLEHFRVLEVGYDKWNAPPFLQPFTEGGLEAWPVPQTITGLTRGSKELERLVIGKQLNNGGNPLLRWMVGNATAQTDHNLNVRPSKTKSKDAIDGVSALVNALACVVREREEDIDMTTQVV